MHGENGVSQRLLQTKEVGREDPLLSILVLPLSVERSKNKLRLPIPTRDIDLRVSLSVAGVDLLGVTALPACLLAVEEGPDRLVIGRLLRRGEHRNNQTRHEQKSQ